MGRTSWRWLAIVTLAAAALVALPGTSTGAGCTITWTGDVDGAWFGGTSGSNTNWSDDTFPDAGDHVCLHALASPYTVTLGPSANVVVDHYSIEAGATLALEGSSGFATSLRATSASTNAGTISFNGGSTTLSTENGTAADTETLTNTGTIAFPAGGTAGFRWISGDLANQGTITVANAEATFQQNAESRGPRLTNAGTVAITAGSVLRMLNSTFAQGAGSTLSGQGTVNLGGGTARLELGGGTIAAPVDVNTSGATIQGTAASTATGNVDVAPGTTVLTGAVPPAITVDIDGAPAFDARLRATADATNAGTINLNGGSSYLSAENGDLADTETLTNTGTIVIPAGGPAGLRFLGGDIANQGTITVAHPEATFQTINESRSPKLTNTGTVAVTAGSALRILNSTFAQGAGSTLGGQGTVNLGGGTARLELAGGQIAATVDVNMSGTTLHGPAGSAATGNVDAVGGTTLLTGTVPAGVTVDVDGVTNNGADLRVTSNAANAGTIRLTGPQSILRMQNDNAADVETLTNTGTIATPAGGGAGVRSILGDVVNQGTISVANDTWFRNGELRNPTLDNSGTLAVTGSLVMFESTLVQAAGGTITGPGPVDFSGSSPQSLLEVRGGQIAASADVNVGGSSDLAFVSAEDATGNIDVVTDFSEHALTGDVPAGISIDIEGTTTLRAAAAVTNAGTVTLAGTGAALRGTTFTNSGTIRSVAAAGGTRALGGTLNSSGTVDLGSSVAFDAPVTTSGTFTVAASRTASSSAAFTQTAGTATVDGTLAATAIAVDGGLLQGTGTLQGPVTNAGEVSPGPGVEQLDVTGSYTQTAAGRLTVRVDAPARDLLAVSGAATLDGRLAISTGTAPTEGQTFEVLQAASRSGQFATVTGSGSGPYDVRYDPGGVTLVTTASADLPALTIDDVSVVEGAGPAEFTLRLSAPAAQAVTVDFATANGTATAPADYTASAGTVTFAPGQVDRPVSVAIAGDGVPEIDETFTVALDDADGARVDDDRGTATILNDDVAIDGISPDEGGDTGTVEMTVNGAGLTPGAGLRLSRAGQADIVAANVDVAGDGRALLGVLDLAGKARGAWDVTVTLADGRGAATRPGAFTIGATRPADVWVKLAGRGSARPDRPYEGWIAYGNTGNVDATGVIIELAGLPRFAPVRLPFAAPAGLLTHNDRGGKLEFFLPRVAPGATGYVPFEPRLPAGPRVSLRARITQGLWNPAGVPTIDPAVQVTTQVAEATATRVRGTHTVTGPQGGDIAFDYQHAPAAAFVAPTAAITQPSAGVSQYRFQGATELSSGVFASYDLTATGPDAAFVGIQRAQGPVGELLNWHAAARPRFPLIDAVGGVIGSAGHDSVLKGVGCLIKNQPPPPRLQPRGGGVLATFGLFAKAAGPVLGGVGDTIRGAGQDLTADTEAALDEATGAPAGDGTTFGSMDKICKPPGGGGGGGGGGGSGEGGGGPAPGGGTDGKDIDIVNSNDPNEKFGPPGFGAPRFVEGDRPFAYNIAFENVATATAPAQEVRITDQLDTTKLDIGTLTLGPVTFGDVYVAPPPGLKQWTTDVDLRPANDLIVRVEGELDEVSGLLTWRFTSLDPATGQPTTDPDAGFLPPNQTRREGEGSVSFSVAPVDGLADGTEIRNAASIVFDTNAPIATGTYLNTIDKDPPVSRIVAAVPADGAPGCPTNLAVTWSGTDAGSGVAGYDVYVATGNEAFRLWRQDTTATAATYTGEARTTYRFLTVARDGAGHAESAPFTTPVAATTGACAGPPAPPATPGVTPRPPVGGRPDRTAPRVTATLTRHRFRRGPKRTPATVAARPGAKAGTTFRITLSEDAVIRIRLVRLSPGVRKGRACRPRRPGRTGRACSIARHAATLTRRSGKAGRNDIAFSGRVGARSLPLGRYRATVTATDAAGNRSAPRVLAFRIVRR